MRNCRDEKRGVGMEVLALTFAVLDSGTNRGKGVAVVISLYSLVHWTFDCASARLLAPSATSTTAAAAASTAETVTILQYSLTRFTVTDSHGLSLALFGSVLARFMAAFSFEINGSVCLINTIEKADHKKSGHIWPYLIWVVKPSFMCAKQTPSHSPPQLSSSRGLW